MTNLIVVVYIFIIIIIHTFPCIFAHFVSPWQSCIEYVLKLIRNIGLMFHNKNQDELLDHEFILCIIFKKITFDECKHFIVHNLHGVDEFHPCWILFSIICLFKLKLRVMHPL
jgi:hypothetical protein